MFIKAVKYLGNHKYSLTKDKIYDVLEVIPGRIRVLLLIRNEQDELLFYNLSDINGNPYFEDMTSQIRNETIDSILN